MKFINEDGEIVEGEPVSPVEGQAIESFRKKLDELPEYVPLSTKSGIIKMLAKNFVIQPRQQVIQEPEYMPDEPSIAQTEYGDFPSPSDTEAA